MRHLWCLWLVCRLGLRDGTGATHHSGVAAFSPPLGRIFDLGVCMTLRNVVNTYEQTKCDDIFLSYLVGMSEPGRALLLAANERNPFIAATAKTFPYIRVAIHPPRLLGLLEWAAGRRTDAVGEALVVPES